MIRGERPVPEPVLPDWEIPLYAHGLTVPEAPPTRVDHEAAVGPLMLGVFNVDRARAVTAFERLAAPAPSVACRGHGDPLTVDAARSLAKAAREAAATG
ncbi:hypothetical protein GCM10010425_11280 [Streptomyces spororaveus]|uniref:Uncharacterized protein n=1 Tax=Streptomyces spororaveus TaxID=284039 RepID=A0ABQ3TNA5_9ACTN|nr:hypothetical protein Sspor_73630 [Streptomyces spororaveus]